MNMQAVWDVIPCMCMSVHLYLVYVFIQDMKYSSLQIVSKRVW